MGLLLKLKNGDTALKSLRYGKDRPGGGDSGQPFINTSIDLKPTSPLDIDGFIRGGIDAPKAALTDVKRLSKYLFNTKNPSGLLFTAKQNILSRVSPKTETSFGIAYGGGFGKTIDASDVGGGTGDIRRDNKSFGGVNAGIYTPLSTIGQAGVGFLGTHLNKQGLDPSGLFPSAAIKKYGEVAFENNRSINNNYQPGVPLNLYRQYLRKEQKYGNAVVKSAKAQNAEEFQLSKPAKQFDAPEVEFKRLKETQSIIWDNPNSLNDPRGGTIYTKNEKLNNLIAGAEGITNNTLNRATNALNTFLIKWNNYLDKRSIRRSDRADARQDRLGGKVDALEDRMEEAQLKPNRFDNRLLDLWNSKGLNKSGTQIITSTPNILSYGGGPGSALGLGSTNIKFATLNDGITPARTGINRKDPYVITGKNKYEYKNYGLTNEYGGIVYNPVNIYGKGASIEYLESKWNGLYSDRPYSGDEIWGEDFLTNIEGEENVSEDKLQPWNSEGNVPKKPTQDIIDLKYIKKYEGQTSRTRRFDIRDTGDAGTYRSKINIKPVNPVLGKSLQSKSQYLLNNVKAKRKNGELVDLIEFTIAVQPGDKVGKNKGKKYLMFPAFLDGISDSYTTDYKKINYMGRPEPFYKYSGFTRDISISFTVVAQSKAEIGKMYEKLNFLASTVAPSYTSEGYMTGNIAYLTIGDVFKNQPGIIGGFSFDIPEEATWDIGLYEDGSGITQGDGAQTPMIVKVTGFKFTPLYDEIPSWGSSIWFGSKDVINTKELLATSPAFLEQESDDDSGGDNGGNDINQFIGPSQEFIGPIDQDPLLEGIAAYQNRPEFGAELPPDPLLQNIQNFNDPLLQNAQGYQAASFLKNFKF